MVHIEQSSKVLRIELGSAPVFALTWPKEEPLHSVKRPKVADVVIQSTTFPLRWSTDAVSTQMSAAENWLH